MSDVVQVHHIHVSKKNCCSNNFNFNDSKFTMVQETDPKLIKGVEFFVLLNV